MIDVLGLKLDMALKRLNEEGIPFEVVETFPRSRNQISGELRVIKQTVEQGIIKITICQVPGFEVGDIGEK